MTETPDIKTLAATKTWGRGRIYDSITETIGDTPLVRLSKLAAAAKVKADVLLKLEFFNPLSSRQGPHRRLDDRCAGGAGKDQPGKTVLIEPTSGNTGIALAFVAAARGYKLILVMPETMSIERRKMLRISAPSWCSPRAAGGMPGAVERAERARRRRRPTPSSRGQFENPANPLVHG